MHNFKVLKNKKNILNTIEISVNKVIKYFYKYNYIINILEIYTPTINLVPSTLINLAGYNLL